MSAAPRYMQVADALISDIATDRYPVGTLLPSEHELSDRYGVSRHTLREAMRRVAERGLISRKQGIGTQVTSRTADTRYVASINALEDLFEYTQQTRLDVIAERIISADGELAAFLGCKPGQRWLSFETRRYPIDGKLPIAHMTSYVSPAFEGIRDHLHEEGVSIYRLLQQHYDAHIADVRQRAEAIALVPRDRRPARNRARRPRAARLPPLHRRRRPPRDGLGERPPRRPLHARHRLAPGLAPRGLTTPQQRGLARNTRVRPRCCRPDPVCCGPAQARIRSAAFSPIMIVAAFVLPRVIVGMTDASATRRPSTP